MSHHRHLYLQSMWFPRVLLNDILLFNLQTQKSINHYPYLIDEKVLIYIIKMIYIIKII